MKTEQKNNCCSENVLGKPLGVTVFFFTMSRYPSLTSQCCETGRLYRTLRWLFESVPYKENAVKMNEVKLASVVAENYGVGIRQTKKSDGLRELMEQQETPDVMARAKAIATIHSEQEGHAIDDNIRTKPIQTSARETLEDTEDSFAITFLAVCYLNGNGFPKDETKAVDLFRHAASMGNVEALLNLGRWERNKGQKERFEWFRKAAELGNAEGMAHLGICYSNGEGTPKDLKEAFYWYKQASDAEEVDGLFNLALCYKLGEGTEPNRQKACKYYTKASKQSNPNAPVNLSIFI